MHYDKCCGHADSFPNIPWRFDVNKNRKKKIKIPLFILIHMMRRVITTECCNKLCQATSYMNNWNVYKANLGKINKNKTSKLIWCWQCLAVAHRNCVEYFGSYKIIAQDYYQCSICAMEELNRKPKITLITGKKVPDYVKYVTYAL